MRFIIVPLPTDWELPKWRATFAREDGSGVDLWFHAEDLPAAKRHVRDRYPDAYFSDESVH